MNIPKPLRRFGCGVLLLVWLLLLLTPCVVVVLAVQREIVIQWSDIPQDELRIWTIQDRDARGIAIANARRVTVMKAAESLTCTVTDIRFLMWEGQADPAHTCSCYQQRENRWIEVAMGPDACILAGEQ